jgi:hypothetical protein
MPLWLKRTFIVLGIVLATIIVAPIVGVYILAHTGKTAVYLDSLKQVRDGALARPCSAIIADMKSNDPATAMTAQALVFEVVKDKLGPEGQEADSRELSGRLAGEVSEFEAACKEKPNRPIIELLQDKNPEAGKKQNL